VKAYARQPVARTPIDRGALIAAQRKAAPGQAVRPPGATGHDRRLGDLPLSAPSARPQAALGGLPPALRAGVEALSGISMDAVRVHYNSRRPAEVGAHAFAQGDHIHLGPGQGRHLPHEAWHLAQQRQGRVRPTLRVNGVAVNDDPALEREADVMGQRAVRTSPGLAPDPPRRQPPGPATSQQVKISKTPQNSLLWPSDARRPAKVLKMGDRTYLVDARKRHWRWDPRGYWVSMTTRKAPSYNRFRNYPAGRGAPRKASMRVLKGSGASYFPKRRVGVVKHAPPTLATGPSKAKRVYREVMETAVAVDGITTKDATAYAQHVAPLLAGTLRFNWCHLHGHGAGGSDQAANIVVASEHANSEQLAIEKVYYRYVNKGIAFSAAAHIVKDTTYLASKIICGLYLGGKLIYQREIDGFLAQKPSIPELLSVDERITLALATSSTGNDT